MRAANFTAFIVFIFLAVLVSGSRAQAPATCNGSLGDPVINQDFGSGANPGAPLASGITNMTYSADPCPEDGLYAIVNNINANYICHRTWHIVGQDHTGNPNGYMMLINASNQPSVFFTQTAPGLCQNTTYEFSAYVMNLITLASSGPDVSQPDITFSVEDKSGQVLATYETGTIPPTELPTWNKYSIFFTTGAGSSDVVVKMTNKAPGGNGNDLVLDDIQFRACGPVIQNGFGSTGSNAPQNLCQGDNATIHLVTTVAGSGNEVYQWQLNNGTGWNDIPGATNTSYDAVFTNAVTGVYQFRMGVGSPENISSSNCRTYSSILTINVNALPVVPPIPNQTVCESNTLTLTASGGATYFWTGPNMTSSNQNPLIINNVTPANAGSYTVVATSAAGCSAPSVQTTVKVIPKVVASISKDDTICSGGSVALLASSNNGIHYLWTPATGLSNDTVPNPVATPAATTTYTVKVSNDGCFDDSKMVTVNVVQSPGAAAGSNQVIFQGQSVKLTGAIQGDSILRYYWTPPDYLSDPNSLTPTASPPHDTTYTLNVVSKTCGTATSSVFVRVFQKVVIPNTFSPNNDGVNDYWDIGALVTYPQSEILVFNRYGQQVFKSIGYGKRWNGTYNGAALPAGSYYYIIDLKNGTQKLSGWVLILR